MDILVLVGWSLRCCAVDLIVERLVWAVCIPLRNKNMDIYLDLVDLELELQWSLHLFRVLLLVITLLTNEGVQVGRCVFGL